MRASQIPAKSFCSIPLSPQFPATPLTSLLWEGKLHLGLERLLSPSMAWDCKLATQMSEQGSGQVSVKPFKLKRGSLPSPCLVLGFPVLGTDVHVARVDKSSSCPCLFARTSGSIAA